MTINVVCKVLIIGAGPSGSIAGEFFRVYADARNDGRFPDVIFYQNSKSGIKAMISSIPAGYAWDEQNTYVKNARARFDTLAELCH